jgi:hypothetical protein
MVPYVTGHSPITFEWLWSQQGEHRVLLPRLIMVGLFWLTHDFRTAMYLNLSLLAMAAASMILLARRLRGRSSPTDAVLPIALLHTGQAEDLLLGFALNPLLAVWISYGLIRTAATLTGRPGSGVILRTGLWLLALPLCGGMGVVMVPALALWLVGWMISGWWSGHRAGRLQTAIGLATILACSSLVALYLYGYQRPSHHPGYASYSISSVVLTMREVLSLVTCPTIIPFWEYSSAAAVLLIAFTVARLILTWWWSPEDRPRTAALVLIMASLLSVVLAVGVGRSGFGAGMGFASRYIPLAAPILAVLYVTWIIYGMGLIGRVIQFSLFILICVSLPSNNSCGEEIGKSRRNFLKQVEYGLKSHVPGTRLVAVKVKEHVYDLGVPDLGLLYEYMEMLKSAKVGLFREFQDDRSARGDIDGDGKEDLITGAEAGGERRVRVFSGADGRVLSDFLAFDPHFAGRVNVAVGDIDDDGRLDIIAGAGPGGEPRVRVFRGTDGVLLWDFLAFDRSFTNGVHVASGNIDGDARAAIITVGGCGSGSHPRTFRVAVESGAIEFVENARIRLRDARRPPSQPGEQIAGNRERDDRPPASPKPGVGTVVR